MKVLLVDDNKSLRLHLAKALTRRDHDTIAVSNGNEAIAQIRNELFDVAVIDMKMIGMDGLQVLRELKEIHPQLIGVILTGHGSISNAVEATKLGAYAYLTKPCDISELETVLTKGYHESIKAMKPFKEIYHGIVGKSPEIKKIVRTINQVKDSPLPSLICGESGVGKELVARALHYDSKRSKCPFIAINCASLKTDLLENEFFGHIKGAFTGATDVKDGIVKLADKGTLFIDEITDMDPQIQASLLRFIEIG
ncbi:MAG TPA: sigma 54-interacting transcriptional regulator, partial [Nitrospinota bacterium]|nr:sigma 54-interacting transcriptional regulator [Nitrospinota bacterium]